MAAEAEVDDTEDPIVMLIPHAETTLFTTEQGELRAERRRAKLLQQEQRRAAAAAKQRKHLQGVKSVSNTPVARLAQQRKQLERL